MAEDRNGTLRVLFTTGRPYLPQRTGGAQSSTNQLAAALGRQGHSAAVLAALDGSGWTALRSRLVRRVSGHRFSRDIHNGYPVFRAWDPTDPAEVVARFRPDVAVVQSGHTMDLARRFETLGIPVVLYFRNVEFDELGGDPASLRDALFISNSEFTARAHEEKFGVASTVIPPLVDPAQYRTESSGESVVFINPCIEKGVEKALEIAARCPDIPFLFQEGWALADFRTVLTERLSSLPNVTLRPRTDDMRSVYGKARIVLAPSKWEEAWGRVATEAHCSGIPVIGSRRGGLPEAIGPGGIVLDHDAPIEDWVGAVRRLWDDPDEHRRLSEAARNFSARPEMEEGFQLSLLLDVLRRAASQRVAS